MAVSSIGLGCSVEFDAKSVKSAVILGGCRGKARRSSNGDIATGPQMQSPFWDASASHRPMSRRQVWGHCLVWRLWQWSMWVVAVASVIGRSVAAVVRAVCGVTVAGGRER